MRQPIFDETTAAEAPDDLRLHPPSMHMRVMNSKARAVSCRISYHLRRHHFLTFMLETETEKHRTAKSGQDLFTGDQCAMHSVPSNLIIGYSCSICRQGKKTYGKTVSYGV